MVRFAAGLFVLVILFAVLERRWPWARRGGGRRPGLALDLVYWFFTPLVAKWLTKVVLAVVLVLLALAAGRGLERETLLKGFGPLSRQPLWLQVVEVLVAADFIAYWMHRLFHGVTLWKFHAIHHSSEHLDWLAAVRVHPVNDVVTRAAQLVPLFLAGFPPAILAAYAPALHLFALMLHADVDWTFGPFRHVIASPVFHRWHHTREDAAQGKNFAGMFPVWDVLFGTFHMPAGAVPRDFGVDDAVPASLRGQLIWPFRSDAAGSREPRSHLSADE